MSSPSSVACGDGMGGSQQGFALHPKGQGLADLYHRFVYSAACGDGMGESAGLSPAPKKVEVTLTCTIALYIPSPVVTEQEMGSQAALKELSPYT